MQVVFVLNRVRDMNRGFPHCANNVRCAVGSHTIREDPAQRVPNGLKLTDFQGFPQVK
jgi:hypothetical protein